MLILVRLDISAADMALFEEYETRVLALLPKHGGRLVERLRSTDGSSEVHLLHFAHAGAFAAFRADPARAALRDLWLASGASADPVEVRRLHHPS